MHSPLFGMEQKTICFVTSLCHPEDMEFECRVLSNELYDNYLEIVTSHAIEKPIMVHLSG